MGAGGQSADHPHGTASHVGVVLEELGDGEVVASVIAQGTVKKVAEAEGHHREDEDEAGLVVDEAATWPGRCLRWI